MAHIWSVFSHLNNTRTYGMGPNPITYLEIKAYCDLTGVELSPRDVDSIKRLDHAYLKAQT